MLKVAIFTEGHSELIFVRTLLFRTIDNSKLSLKCLTIRGEQENIFPYSYASPNPRVFFLVVCVGNDERVLSAIKDREAGLFQQGYLKIIGLRDMYSEAYDKRSNGVINERITKDVICSAQTVINNMSRPDSVALHFAIMELESWFLAMYDLFAKINERLSVEYIDSNLNINLRTVDPQKEFYRPSNQMKDILSLVNKRYDKSRDISEMICSKMDDADFRTAIENGRCQAFRVLYEEVDSYRFEE